MNNIDLYISLIEQCEEAQNASACGYSCSTCKMNKQLQELKKEVQDNEALL